MSTVTREYAKWTYEDKPRGIRIIVKQVHARHFEASAHLTVVAENEYGSPYNLYKGRTPITTEAARTRVGRTIESKIQGDEKKGDVGMKAIFGISAPVVTNDWEATVTEACEMVLESYYAGTSPINLYDDESEEDDIWRIPALLSEDVNVLYGQSGSGKSYLGIIWGQAIQHGADFCGLRVIKGNVLLIDYETTPSKMRRRFKRVDAGMNLDGKPMLYIPASVPIASMVEPLQDYIAQHEIDFVIVDSLARAVGGKITDEEGVGLMFEALRQLQKACLIIHHTNRGDDYYGSPYIRANARNLWRLRSVQNEGQQKLSIQLQQEKENDGPGIGEIGFVLEFQGDPVDPDAVVLQPQESSQIPELRKYLRLWQRLEAYIEETQNHRIEMATIPEEFGLSASQKETFRNYIWALTHDTDRQVTVKKLFHVDGKWLCLNTELGNAPMDRLPDEPQSANSLVDVALNMGMVVTEETVEEQNEVEIVTDSRGVII